MTRPSIDCGVGDEIDLAVRDIARELGSWGDRLGRDTRADRVRQAVADLRGSVHREAMREMAVRLAVHRMGSLIDSRQGSAAAA